MNEIIERLKLLYGKNISRISKHSNKFKISYANKESIVHVYLNEDDQIKEASILKQLEKAGVLAPKYLSSTELEGIYINEFSILTGNKLSESFFDPQDVSDKFLIALDRFHSVKSDGLYLVHGDLNPNNLIYEHEIGFLDMTHSYFGDPYFDYIYLFFASIIYEKSNPRFSNLCKSVWCQSPDGAVKQERMIKYLELMRSQDRFGGALNVQETYLKCLGSIKDIKKPKTTPKRDVVNANVGISCNNNCIFCSDGDKHNHEGPQDIKWQILNKKHLGNIQFVYSEPTLNPNLINYINLAKDEGYSTIGLSTNGRMLGYKSYLRELIDAGLNEVTVSLHGHSAKLHDSLTRSPDSFKQVLKGLENLSKSGLLFNIATTLTKANIKYLKDILYFASKYKPNSHIINIVEPRGYAKALYSNLLVPYSDLLWELNSMGSALTKFKISIPDMPYCAAGEYKSLIGSRESQEGHVGKLDYDSSKVKRDKCKDCEYNSVCEGVWKEYIATKGWDEFEPVNSEKYNFFRFLTYKLTKADSYPPIEFYKPLRLEEVKDAWKRSLKTRTDHLGLFIYIPFCQTKCFFCRSYSIIPKGSEVEDYIRLIEDQCDWYKELFKNQRFSTIYLGGGTPSFLNLDQIKRVFSAISYFKKDDDCQFIFESSPSTINPEKIELLSRLGVNRLCIGVQSLTDEAMKQNARFQNKEMVLSAIKAARKYKIRHISIDIIAGLIGENKEDFRNNLREITSMRPDFINVYPFEPSSNSLFHKFGKELTNSQINDRNSMQEEAHAIILGKGYKQVRNSMYGLEDEARNKQETNAIEYNASLLGIGYNARCHAYGELVYRHLDARQVNLMEEGFYYHGKKLTKRDEMIRYIISNMKDTLRRNDFLDIFKIDIVEAFPNQTKELVSLGKWKLTEKYILSNIDSRAEQLIYSRLFYDSKVLSDLRSMFSDFETDNDYRKELKEIFNG